MQTRAAYPVRKKVPRFYGNHRYFVTCDTKDRFPYFKEPALCELLISQLQTSTHYFHFNILAYCILYEHVHLIIENIPDYTNLSQVVGSMKRNFSLQANMYLGHSDVLVCKGGLLPPAMRPSLSSTDDSKGGLLPPGLSPHNITGDSKSPLQLQLPKPSLIEPPIFRWHKSFHDRIIRNDEHYKKAMNYVIYNFLKHGLPEDWPYTSLRRVIE